MLLIRFENYYEGKPVSDISELKTKKPDKFRHGYGLKSIRYIAEKYNGFMNINSDGNWMVVQVVIPYPESK